MDFFQNFLCVIGLSIRWEINVSIDEAVKLFIAHEGSAETVIYDNGFDQYITGGNIVIHTSMK